ncbi:MAG TPA: hypothetical protein VG076_02650 [Acidimicrobiales bacterium]|nr:hypothetical protein [Acidimicrobiales bacterium]
MEFLSWVRDQWDRVGAVVLVVVGALALLLGWIGISDAVLPSEQLPYLLSGGLVGVFLLGVGTTMWLSADLRDEWRKLDRLEELVRGQGEVEVDEVVVANGASATDTDAETAPTNGSRKRRPAPKPVKTAS